MMGGVNGALDYVTTMGLGYVTPGVDGAKPTATVTQSTKQVSCRNSSQRILSCLCSAGHDTSTELLFSHREESYRPTVRPILFPSRFQTDSGSSPDLGTLLGCLLGGWLGDRLGRKKTIWIGCIWITIGAPLQASRSSLLPPFQRPRFSLSPPFRNELPRALPVGADLPLSHRQLHRTSPGWSWRGSSPGSARATSTRSSPSGPPKLPVISLAGSSLRLNSL